MNRTMTFTMMSCAFLLSFSPDVGADIISFSGDVDILPSAPISVMNSALESDEKIRVFAERSGIELSQPLSVNILQPSLTTTYMPNPAASGIDPGDIPASSTVNSYFVHFDPIGEDKPGTISLAGSLTFSEVILGLMVFKDGLDATDSEFGAVGTLYGAVSPFLNRGLEDNGGNGPPDTVTLFADAHTLNIDVVFAGTGIDQIRVFTAPEPQSLFLVLVGALVTRRRVGAHWRLTG